MRAAVPLRAVLAAALPLFGAVAQGQTLFDPDLSLETVVTGIALPTQMAFLGPDDLLVTEKDTGRVRRVLGGTLLADPVLEVPVSPTGERGLLGIAINTEDPPQVFLYYTEAAFQDGPVLGNRVYRYTWNPGTGMLESPVLLIDMPDTSANSGHNGGVVRLGVPGEGPPVGDGAFLYAVIGDRARNGQLQNFSEGPPPDDTSVIFRVLQDGSAAPGNPFAPYCSATTAQTCASDLDCPPAETCTLEVARYYAYGVRNSFGLAVDPVTGDLWDTENGFMDYDEVNRVEPGMNSGWEWIMGPDARDPHGLGDLFDMPGAGSTYSDPEFSWLDTVAPTGLIFPIGSQLGRDYDDTLLVGDVVRKQIYALPLNGARDGFDFSGSQGVAGDRVADDDAERDQFAIGGSFGNITDLEIGPEGALYVLSLSNGALYRIVGPPRPVPALGLVAFAACAGAILLAARLALSR